MSELKFGLGNAVDDSVEVIHGNLIGRRSFGRVSDLTLAWIEAHTKKTDYEISRLRLLMQALFEMAYTHHQKQSGHFECALAGDHVLLAARYTLKATHETIEKEMLNLWNEDPNCRLLNKFLGRHDRVEILYSPSLSLIEWRIYFTETAQNNDSGNIPSFLIHIIDEKQIETHHQKYTELGDLNYQKLLSEAYRSAAQKSRTGDFKYKDRSVSEDDDGANVIFEKEINALLEDSVLVVSERYAELKQKMLARVKGDASVTHKDELNDFTEDAQDQVDETELKAIESDATEIAQVEFDQINAQRVTRGEAPLPQEVKEIIRAAKYQELLVHRKLMTYKTRLEKLEELLRQKEASKNQIQSQMRILNEKLVLVQNSSGQSSQAKAFRDKAIEMHNMLKVVKESNVGLTRQVRELKAQLERMPAGEEGLTSAPAHTVQVEELTKRQERTQRALDAEKLKVKQLSERLVQAEKDTAQASRLKTDLENKMEQANRVAALHRKDLDAQKQKLVQIESEKGKLQAEINRLKTELQTLQKRSSAA